MKRFHTISEFLQFRQLPKPAHPLIYVFQVDTVQRLLIEEPVQWAYDFYAIGLKRVANAQEVKLKYGQQHYDYDEGILSFVAPGQVMSFSLQDSVREIKQSGWMVLIHPDLLWNTPLAKKIQQYDFWDYAVNEALFLSDKEEGLIVALLQNVQQESQANIDQFSKSIIISHIETLLNYADRFYHRQFITREKAHYLLLNRVEQLLNEHFNSEHVSLPTVAGIAEALNLSPKYLGSLLKVLTGLNAQQHIHEKLIEKAKTQLTTTDQTVSEIAYGLGFEHIQSFNKLFKNKTQLSPLEFRASFN